MNEHPEDWNKQMTTIIFSAMTESVVRDRNTSEPQSLVKHREEADRVYADYQDDIELISGLVGGEGALHDEEKGRLPRLNRFSGWNTAKFDTNRFLLRA